MNYDDDILKLITTKYICDKHGDVSNEIMKVQVFRFDIRNIYCLACIDEFLQSVIKPLKETK